MRQVNVALAWPLSAQQMDRIQAISPSLHLRAISELVRTEIRLLRQSPGSPEQRRATAKLDEALHDAEVLLSAYRLPENVPQRTPKLRWVQGIGAGMDRILSPGFWDSGIVLTNARGVAARPIAEWVLGAMLMFAKEMHLFLLRKLKHEYDTTGVNIFSLQGKTVGILGLGTIGGEVARLAKALEMQVMAIRRTVATPPPYVDRLLLPSAIGDVLRASDFVVIALPLTQETAKSFGERELRLMKPSAYLINIARGAIVDEAALVMALKEGWIAGAALDVFEREPLPRESELWSLENVILTPHTSGQSENHDDRIVELFRENLRRYLAGEPLLNVVDKTMGY